MTGPRCQLPLAITESGVLAIVRGDHDARSYTQIADALVAAGVRAAEVAANSLHALEGVAVLSSVDDLEVGVGTILSREAGEVFLAAGASYLVMPHVDEELIGWATSQKIPTLPGAFTATEVLRAWQAGASAVKLFPGALPSQPMLGPEYLAALRGPLDDVLFVPTGGISTANAGAFIAQGAVAVAAASWLVPQHAEEVVLDVITQRGRDLIVAVANERKAQAERRSTTQETT